MEKGHDARVTGFSVSLETSQLSQFPGFEFAFGVEAVRVVHVRVNLLRLLCAESFGISSAVPTQL